jgi:uncharacterized protein YxjI
MRYLVRERIFSIGTDFWVEDEYGNRPFYVDGKALSVREACELRDADGNLLTRIHKKLLAMRDTMEIEAADGHALAKVRPAFFSPIKHRYEIDLSDGQRLEAVGNFTDKDWEIAGADGIVGRVSRHWFHIRDAYGVEVAPGVNDPLIISIAVCIDHIHEDKIRERQAH